MAYSQNPQHWSKGKLASVEGEMAKRFCFLCTRVLTHPHMSKTFSFQCTCFFCSQRPGEIPPGITTHALHRRRGAASVPVAHVASTAPLIGVQSKPTALEQREAGISALPMLAKKGNEMAIAAVAARLKDQKWGPGGAKRSPLRNPASYVLFLKRSQTPKRAT